MGYEDPNEAKTPCVPPIREVWSVPTMSVYISELTIRRLDTGYVVTWLEDGEPCGSETISEKLAMALTRSEVGASFANDASGDVKP